MSSSSSPHGAHGGAPDKSPLASLNLNFLKTLNEKRTTRDGNPPKRRGPKPDSKPALTRRQELNRQAQRTHRERKELYIKALEDEVLRLKEVYTNASQDKNKLAEENRQLRNLLHQNGLSPAAAGVMDDVISNPSLGYASSGDMSGSYAPGFSTASTPPLTSISSATSLSNSQLMGTAPGLGQSGVDYDQAGIDFVLTLEKPCMDHLPWLLDRSADAPGEREPCGHALMASCPPEPFGDLNADIPFGFAHGAAATTTTNNNNTNAATNGSGPSAGNNAAGAPGVDGADSGVVGSSGNKGRTWELSKGDLTTLLDLSKKLDLDGEITPVMAWGMILSHPRLTDMTRDDIDNVIDNLNSKVRCYGFGAVMEEFEVRDAVNAVLSAKPEVGMVY